METKTKIILGLAAGAGLYLMVNKVISPKPPAKPKYKSDDINLLLPAFRSKVQLLLSNLQEMGFDPVPVDTARTQKEADANAKKGTGISKSLHIYGAATDIISGSKGRSDNKFNAALIKESKKLGLTSGANKKYGGNFPNKHDVAHVQAIPIKLQPAFRSLVSVNARNIFISEYYKTLKTGADYPIV
jgi:hypothetical protein